jgi:hypothetical protein
MYAQLKGVDVTTLRFLLRGARICPLATAAENDLQDGDVLNVYEEQCGD